MLAEGMRNASIRYERSTSQISTAIPTEPAHPFVQRLKACSRSRISMRGGMETAS